MNFNLSFQIFKTIVRWFLFYDLSYQLIILIFSNSTGKKPWDLVETVFGIQFSFLVFLYPFWNGAIRKNPGPFSLPRKSKWVHFCTVWPSRHMVNWNQIKHSCVPLLKNSNAHGYTDERLIHTLPFVAHLGTKKAVGRIKTRPQRLNQLVEVRLGVKFRRGWVIAKCFEIPRTFSL